MGAIVAFNALISSLFIYKMTVLPNITEKYRNCFDKIARDFIWAGKRSKIQLKILQGNRIDGGLGLTNLGLRDASLKIQWIFKWQRNEQIRQLANLELNNQLGELLWQTQIKPKDISYFVQEKNFWTDVWEDWSKINLSSSISKEQVKKQVLWKHSDIRIEGKPVIKKNWLDQGIARIEDILDDLNHFLLVTQLQNKFQIRITFIELWGLIQAIPINWKRWLKEDTGPAYKDWFLHLNQFQKVAHVCYKVLNENSGLMMEIVNRWNNKGYIIFLEDMLKYVQRIYQIINVPK